MPNHVSTTFTFNGEKEMAKIQEILAKPKSRLVDSILPMPKALVGSVESNQTPQEEKDRLTEITGFESWYRFALSEWGTKWGDYEGELEIEENQVSYRFNTAWSPFGDKFMVEFTKIFQNYSLYFEEEQGWGGEVEVENGEVVFEKEWDSVDIYFEEVEGYEDGDIVYLPEPYEKGSDIYKPGFYAYWDLQDYLGDTLAKAEIANLKIR